MRTCFSKDVFDPHGSDTSDYFDEIEADMKREMERKELERKKSLKVDFVPRGTQPGTVAPALKISTQIPVAGISAAVTSGSSTAPDATRECRQTRKLKWDKIDGDVKNPVHSSGHDNLSAVGVHAAHLSAANAGTGYTAFAQQKREKLKKEGRARGSLIKDHEERCSYREIRQKWYLIRLLRTCSKGIQSAKENLRSFLVKHHHK